MSVNYEAKYGFGFVITEKDINELTPEQHDKIIDSDFFHCIDGWRDDEDTPYFFGIVLNSLEPGEFSLVPIYDVFKLDKLKQMTTEFKTYSNLFYKYHYGPRHYVFCSIT
jgi:hypothetical protein